MKNIKFLERFYTLMFQFWGDYITEEHESSIDCPATTTDKKKKEAYK